jgi:hypothetical protein
VAILVVPELDGIRKIERPPHSHETSENENGTVSRRGEKTPPVTGLKWTRFPFESTSNLQDGKINASDATCAEKSAKLANKRGPTSAPIQADHLKRALSDSRAFRASAGARELGWFS